MSKLSLWIQTMVSWNEYKFKEKKLPTKIDKISKKNKNVSAKFSKKTQADILIRDKTCILCSKPIQDFHHVFFGTQSYYWNNRNERDQWVWLCREHHNEVHSCKQWTWVRQKCIDYVNSYYNNWLRFTFWILDDCYTEDIDYDLFYFILLIYILWLEKID